MANTKFFSFWSPRYSDIDRGWLVEEWCSFSLWDRLWLLDDEEGLIDIWWTCFGFSLRSGWHVTNKSFWLDDTILQSRATEAAVSKLSPENTTILLVYFGLYKIRFWPVIMTLAMLLDFNTSMAEVLSGLSLFCRISSPMKVKSFSKVALSILSTLWYFTFGPKSLVAKPSTRKPLKRTRNEKRS